MKYFYLIFATLFFALNLSAQVTTSDSIQIGKPGSSANKEIKFGAGRGAKPGIRYNTTNSKLEFSNDASIFKALGSGSGSGTGINLLDNPGFEDGIGSNWTSSGTSLVAVTSGANLLFDLISASWTPSATGHYFESNAVVIPKGLYGAACMAEVWYQGGDANAYLTVFNSSTEIIPTSARATLNATTGMKKAKVYFDCPSSGSLKLRVQSTAAMAVGYFDKAHLGQADFAQSKQSNYVGGITWNNQAGCIWQSNATTFTTLPAQASCPTPVVNGSVTAPGTKIPAVVLPFAQKGTYYFVATGLFQKFATTDSIVQFRFSDGVNSSNSNVLRNSSAFHGVPVIAGTITLTSDTANWTVAIQGQTSNVATNYAIENVASGQAQDIQVYFYPSGTDSIVNSKCVNDIACENNFTAQVSTTGIVSGENLDWIAGNCATPSTGQKTCTFNTSVFSDAPNCTITNAAGVLAVATVQNLTTALLTYNTFNIGGAGTNYDTFISCQRRSLDFKPRQTIQGFFSNMVTSTNAAPRIEALTIGQASKGTTCTSSPCGVFNQSGAVSTVTRASAGIYSINFLAGTFSGVPVCTVMSSAGGNINCTEGAGSTSSTITINCVAASTSAVIDAGLNVTCIGPR